MTLHAARLAFAFSLPALLAAAEPPRAGKPEGQAAPVAAPAPKVHRIAGITVTGSFRTRQEGWGWFTPDSGEPNYLYSGNLFRLALSQSRENWGWTAEFAVPFLLGLPSSATGPGTQGALGLGSNYFTANQRNQNATGLFLKQAFLTVKHGGTAVRLGRFEFNDGSETAPKNGTLAALKATRINMRLLGHFGWTHVGRSFDGLHYSMNLTDAKKAPAGNFTFVGGVPTRGVFQTDGWGWNQTAFGYSSFTKPWGKGRHAADTRVFGLYYDDWRNVLKTDSRTAAARRADLNGDIRIITFGGHSVHAITTKTGTFDLLLWGAGQAGNWGGLDHRAYAVDFEAGIQPSGFIPKWKPWIRGGYGISSGDANPNDNTHGTFFQVMPTPRPFARFPFFNMMNNRDLHGALILRPHAKLSISSEFHSLALRNASDLWYQGGGVFQPWTFGYAGRATGGAKSLANLYDTSVDVKLTPALSLNVYYGFAQGLAAVRSIYPKGQSGHLGYAELTYKF